MDAHVVVGSNYGDEGKGLMTDYLVRRHNADVVVRFNGGAQAGHTVVTPDNVRHVFSHFGSGTLAGADTFLSQFFVVNPILFVQELKKLPAKTKVMVDPNCMVTTPWDMLINQALERKREGARHGSCGVGFNETIERSIKHESRLLFGSLYDNPEAQLVNIRNNYIPARCDALGLSADIKEACMDLTFHNVFTDAVREMQEHVEVTFPFQLQGKRIVFEGAQGLCLDQNNRLDFPHLTRSNTGMKNVAILAPLMGVDYLEAVYVTRTYLTRHGAGPLPNEWAPEDVPKTIGPDATNVPHPFQGNIRYAPLDVDALLERMLTDWEHAHGIASGYRLAVTCGDHMDVGEVFKGCPFSYLANGPTHEHVERQ